MRFGISRVLIFDNGLQFIGKEFGAYLEELNIIHMKSSVGHPQANGHVEVTNHILLRSIEKRLHDAKEKWVEELPGVLWAYRITKSTTRENPFKLAYGTEAVIPEGVRSASFKIDHFNEQVNFKGIRLNLDLLARIVEYQLKIAQYYDQRVKPRVFK